MNPLAEADPVTSAALCAVGNFGYPTGYQIAALQSAIEVLQAAFDLEQQLERTGEFAITRDTMHRVRVRKDT